MRKFWFAGLKYTGLNNLGDNIQSIAVERLLPSIEQRFNRDTLALANPTLPSVVIMNGWFSHQPQTCLPLSNYFYPVFFGFHITDWNDSWRFFSQKHIVEYLKRYEPIGCRDPHTAGRLSQMGIKTHVTYCLTLTFPKRKQEPLNGKIIVVDLPRDLLPENIHKQAIFYSHSLPGYKYRESLKRILAHELLNVYCNQANLVITSRLHCLLPCIAMGIPAIFFGDPDDYRISWVTEMGVNIFTTGDLNKIDWNPTPIPFEEKKAEMINEFNALIDPYKR